MLRWGRWCVTLQGRWSGLPERRHTFAQTWPSTALAELWIPRIRQSQGVLHDKRLTDKLPTCQSISGQISQTPFTSESLLYTVDPAPFLADLEQLQHILRQVRVWPPRYWFAPSARVSPAAPVFSRRKLPTGLMEAGYQVCHINRNWDGIDRLDDLSQRDEFLDDVGVIHIVRQSLWAYMGHDLLQWINALRHGHLTATELIFTFLGEDHETKIEQIMSRAERWRQQVGIPDYRIERIDDVEKHWQQLLQQKNPALRTALDMAAYASELMRTLWCGEYRPCHPDDLTHDTLPFQIPHAKKKSAELPTPEPNVVLTLPFGQTVAPLHKAVHSLFARRKFAWTLQINVLDAHRRQGSLLQQLGHELFSSHPLRVRGALRLLCDIADLRVEDLLDRRLLLEQDPLHLCVILERMEQAPKRLAANLLTSLAYHPHPAVVGRVLWLLFLRQEPQLPVLMEHLIQQDVLFSVRPLAHHVLTHTTGDKRLAKQILRKLGPIPPVRKDEDLFLPKPGPWNPLPLLAEILEDCANPTKQQVAMQILEDWPNLPESDTLGSALADPNPTHRLQVIGLLSGSDRPPIRELLRTRLLFESDASCRGALQSVLAN